MYERMLNKQETPTMEEMIKFCGENSERFSLLNEWLASAFNTEQKVVFPYGNKYDCPSGIFYEEHIFSEKWFQNGRGPNGFRMWVPIIKK